MKLPYSILPAKPDAAFPHRTGVGRPIVALHLARDGKEMIVFAVVDSGADHCVFPASIAEALGIPIPNQSASVFSGSSEKPQIAYFEQIQATILPMDSPGIEPGQLPLPFPLYAGFCDTLEHLGMGLLGQEGFFSRFDVHFHSAQNYFEIL